MKITLPNGIVLETHNGEETSQLLKELGAAILQRSATSSAPSEAPNTWKTWTPTEARDLVRKLPASANKILEILYDAGRTKNGDSWVAGEILSHETGIRRQGLWNVMVPINNIAKYRGLSAPLEKLAIRNRGLRQTKWRLIPDFIAALEHTQTPDSSLLPVPPHPAENLDEEAQDEPGD